MLALMTSQAQHPGDRMRDRRADDEAVLSAWSTLAGPVTVETSVSTGAAAVVVDLQQEHTDWVYLPALAGPSATAALLPSCVVSGTVRSCWWPLNGRCELSDC